MKKLSCKIISMLLVLVLVFTAVSCSNNSASTPPTNPPGWTNPGLSDPNEEIETEITEIESELNSEAVQSDYEKLIEYTQKLQNKNEELDVKYILWEELQESILE